MIQEFKKRHPNIEVFDDSDRLQNYAKDEVLRGSMPLGVILPKTKEDVINIAKFSTQKRIPIIPRGSGTGLSGAAVPLDSAIIVSFEKMNQILSVDERTQLAIVQPGVITGDIRNAAQSKGLFYPPLPASVDSCSIGGNVSTNAGGLCAVKYGVTREYVVDVEMVLSDGQILHTGAPLAKNSTAYNLTQLVVGSEGTLGLITEITLKLIPFPKERVTLLAGFQSLDEVSNTVLAILDAQITPTTLELIPKGAIRCVLNLHPDLSYPFADHEASLLIELDGFDVQSIESQLERLEAVLTSRSAENIRVAQTPRQREELWDIRKRIRDSIASSGEYVEADSVVPKHRLPELVRAAEDVARIAGVESVSYGHAGDGNLHTYFRRNKIPEKIWGLKSEHALKLFYERTIELGGLISGEHGIGILRKRFLSMTLSPEHIELMKRIKQAFDPHHLMNPGKVLPDA